MYFSTGQTEDSGILGWFQRGIVDPFKKVFTKDEPKKEATKVQPTGKEGEPTIVPPTPEEPLWRKLLIPGLIVGGVIYFTRKR